MAGHWFVVQAAWTLGLSTGMTRLSPIRPHSEWSEESLCPGPTCTTNGPEAPLHTASFPSKSW